MKYIMSEPFKISARLNIALFITANSTIEYHIDKGLFYFHIGNESIAITDFTPGLYMPLHSQFIAILAFINAWHEALTNDGEGDNTDLFDRSNKTLMEWVTGNADTFELLYFELHETETDLIRKVD